MDKVVQILQERLGISGWEITKPEQGVKKECYVAAVKDTKVFLKFKIDVPPLARLAELQIAPKILVDGEFHGESYVIQEYIDGNHPERAWLQDHWKTLASIMQRYHADEELRKILAHTHTEEYKDYLQREIGQLRGRVEKVTDPAFEENDVRDTFQKFLAMADVFAPVTLTPVHDEPNTSNMIVSGNRFVLIDWDDVTLGDPLRDLGPLLWWYIPETNWQEFLLVLGITMNDEVRRKVYWYAARASLEVALWFRENNYASDQGFLQDFLAASQFKANPRG